MASADVGDLPPDPPDIPELVIDRKDPLARAVVRAFGRQPLLLFVVMATVGIACVYLLPYINGTLLPRPPAKDGTVFISASNEVNSQIVWVVLMPIAAVAYVRQLVIIPRMFNALFENGVLGLSQDKYHQFLVETEKTYNQRRWLVINIAGFGTLWLVFVAGTAVSPYTWYHARNTWPWILYLVIQTVENFAGVSFAFRHYVTARRLRDLLREVETKNTFHPQVLHPDGVCGCGPVVGFVLNGLVFGTTAFFVLWLQLINTLRSEPQFKTGPGVLIYVAAAVIYALLGPYVLVGPLRVVTRSLRKAKERLLLALSASANSAIWGASTIVSTTAINTDAEQTSPSLSDALRNLHDSAAALDTIPETLREALFGLPARTIAFGATVVPLVAPLTAFVQDHWNVIGPFVRPILP